MDEVVPAATPPCVQIAAAPPRSIIPNGADTTQQVEMQMQDREISVDMIVPAEVNAPPRVEMRREDGQVSTNASPGVEMQRAYSRKISIAYLRHLCHLVPEEMPGLCDELRDKQTYLDCLDTCCFFCFCHAITSLFLSITICCRCCNSMLKTPDCIQERTRSNKVAAFFAKHLSTLWVLALLTLFARWMLFRPVEVKPHLATSTVHEFELKSMGGTPLLSFNVTTYVLFHTNHDFYNIRYRHFAGSIMYADVKLGPTDDGELLPFTQKPHEITLKRLSFAGRLRNATGMVEEKLNRERQLQMLVKIRVSLNYGFWPFKGDYFTMYDCPLHSPFPHMGEPAVSLPAWCNIVHL